MQDLIAYTAFLVFLAVLGKYVWRNDRPAIWAFGERLGMAFVRYCATERHLAERRIVMRRAKEKAGEYGRKAMAQ